MIITLAASQNYAMPLATTLRSIAESNRRHWPLEFWVLHDGFKEELRQKVLSSLPEGSASLIWVPVEMNLFANFSSGEADYLSKMAYARLLIPTIFPERIAKVLYLDADLLVLEDLAPLWQADLKGAAFGAVADFYLHTAYLEKGLNPQAERSDHFRYKATLPNVPTYFNSGVLLIDLARWREEHISEKAFAYLKRHPSPFMDQDALNFAAEDKWQALTPRWNEQNHHTKLGDKDRHGILHFVAGAKPWQARSRNPNAALYDRFRSRTAFARTRLEKAHDFFLRFRSGVNNTIKRGGFRKENNLLQDIAELKKGLS